MKQNPFSFLACFVFLALALALALAYCLFSFNFPQFDYYDERTVQPSSSVCDLFRGEWIRDANVSPYYTNRSCFSIEGHQNCMKNGRPDTDYLSWRWNPTDCDLPKFDAFKFLRFMSAKSMAFIGDSIMRNHAHSLLCTLSQVPFLFHSFQFPSPLFCFGIKSVSMCFIGGRSDRGVSRQSIQEQEMVFPFPSIHSLFHLVTILEQSQYL